MKILIVNNMQPFVWGGAEELASNLSQKLIEHGHEAEVMRLPFHWEPSTNVLSQMLMVRALELVNVDHVIALKFPAYFIRHSKKTIWLLHQFRQAYDLFDAGISNIPRNETGDQLRAVIRNADKESFAEARKVFTISETTRNRLKKYNKFESEVLVPPLNDPHLFQSGKYGDYIFAGGRINSMKRQHILLESFARSKPSLNLVIAGPPDTEEDALRLISIVEENGLADRVKLDLRFLPRFEYSEYVNNALAVACLPFDEDSLSYVAMEAASSSKAIISLSDSGGVLGLAKDNETGWVVEPNVDQLSGVLNSISNRRAQAAEFGRAANDLLNKLGINWDATIEKLLG